jgi:fucose permease
MTVIRRPTPVLCERPVEHGKGGVRRVAVLTGRAGDEVGAAIRATYAAFIATGFAFASWAARIPQVRDRLELDPSGLGLVLLAIACGAVLALPMSGPVVSRHGSRWTVTVMSVLGVGLIVVAFGYRIGVAPVVAGLFAFGIGTGSWDVAMNVQGALVERRHGRAIMPRFHAGFSVGTVAGALGGAAMVALGVSVTLHLAIVGLAVAVAVPFAVRGFIADHADPDDAAAASDNAARASLAAWREPRTLLVGVFVLAFAFAEGSGNDWIGVALIDGHGVDAAIGTLGFATFLTAMTAGRWFGRDLLDRYGRVVVVRALTLVAIAGLVLFSFGPGIGAAFVGTVLWGVGISLGFPVGMSAGADDPRLAAPRVSVISSIGYCAFLGGPPLIGFLGQHVTVLHALAAVLALLVLAALLADAVRPLPSE